MSDPNNKDRELAKRFPHEAACYPDRCTGECPRADVIEVLAEQREQFQDESTVYQELSEQLAKCMAAMDGIEGDGWLWDRIASLRERADAAEAGEGAMHQAVMLARRENLEQEDRIRELETLYMQAVAGRKTFRQKYRELRDRIRELETDGRRLNWLLDQEIGYHGRSDIDAAIAAEETSE